MQMHMSAQVSAEDIASCASDDAKFLGAILEELGDFVLCGDSEMDEPWLADFAGNLNARGRNVLMRLAKACEGRK